MTAANTSSPFSGILYVGTYGNETSPTIQVCNWNGETGQLTPVQQVTGVENASYLALHHNGQFLYAVSETAETKGSKGGGIVSFSVEEETGRLSRLNDQLTHGEHPCYVSVDESGNVLLVANYTGGNAASYRIHSISGEHEPASTVVNHEGSGPNAARQEAPHAHAIVPHGQFAYVTDLGTDTVAIYRIDTEAAELELHDAVKVHAGAGPRHIIFHSALTTAYLINELDSTVTVFQSDKEQGKLEAIQTLSALPEGYNAYNDAADIHLHPSGKFLYTSNRGHNSIAVFAVNESDGTLTPVQHVSCGGETPRNFAVLPDGRYVLVANQNSSNIVAYTVDEQTGVLTPTGAEWSIPNPVNIRIGRSL